MQKLLMLGTSKGSCEMVAYAKSQGIYTIVTDPRLPEDSRAKIVADEYWMIDISDIDTLEKKCISDGISGISCGISTFCIPVVMELCRRLNLPAYCTPETWKYTMDKYEFKKMCRSYGVPVATDYFVSDPPTEPEIDNIVLPVMVKAVDQSANRGMSYCYDREDILPAIEYAHSFSKNRNIVVERMLHGTEYTAYYALANGKSSLISLFSDLSQPGTPGKCYAINSTACDKLDLYLKEIHPGFTRALEGAGFKEGVCWIELMLDEDGHFYVIEMGYRMSGDMMAIPIDNVFGFNSYKWLVDIAMGIKHLEGDLPKSQGSLPKKCGCSYILWSNDSSGVVSRIDGVDRITSLPGVALACDVKVGSHYNPNQYLLTFLIDDESVEGVCRVIEVINREVSVFNEFNEDISLKFTDLRKLKDVYYCR